jgi:hypothetical protein
MVGMRVIRSGDTFLLSAEPMREAPGKWPAVHSPSIVVAYA